MCRDLDQGPRYDAAHVPAKSARIVVDSYQLSCGAPLQHIDFDGANMTSRMGRIAMGTAKRFKIMMPGQVARRSGEAVDTQRPTDVPRSLTKERTRLRRPYDKVTVVLARSIMSTVERRRHRRRRLHTNISW